MARDAVRIGETVLADFTQAIFVAAGVGPADAALWARTLVWANLRGVDSHGVMRAPRYLDLIRRGAIRTSPSMRLIGGDGALCRLDADFAPGPVAMARAMEEAISRARRCNVGWCLVRDLTHAGAVGYFALMAAQAGMAGIVMSASNTLMMSYHGAASASLSSNPLAIAVPAGARAPLLLDMSTTTVSMGKVLDAKAAGVPIPSTWGLDRDGRPTTDPAAVATLLPAAGAKGSGLSLMIEALTSIAVGNPLIGFHLSGMHMNGAAVAVDLSALSDIADLGQGMDALIDHVSTLAPADPEAPVLPPGGRGEAEAAKRRALGIPLSAAVWSNLCAAAADLGVSAPDLS